MDEKSKQLIDNLQGIIDKIKSESFDITDTQKYNSIDDHIVAINLEIQKDSENSDEPYNDDQLMKYLFRGWWLSNFSNSVCPKLTECIFDKN